MGTDFKHGKKPSSRDALEPKPVQLMRGQTRMMLNHHGEASHVVQEAPCKILQECGSCPSLDLPYKPQLELKTQDLRNKVKESVLFANVPVRDCEASSAKLAYRYTAKLVVAEDVKPHGRWIKIGLYKPGSHEVIDIGRCPVQSDDINLIVAFVRGALRAHNISIYNPRTQKGLVRYLVVRTAYQGGQALVTFVTSTGEKTALRTLSRELCEKIPKVQGVLQHVNPTTGNEIFKQNDGATAGVGDAQSAEAIDNTILLSGVNYLEDQMLGLNMRISAASFFQVNPFVAEKLYNRILEVADPSPRDTVLDLYCGVGGISLNLAKAAKVVFGIEESTSSIGDAVRNAKYNNIKNAEFFAGRAEELLPTLKAGGPLAMGANIVVLNPSRRGCQKSVLEIVASMTPRSIVYMSCFPDTLLRDLKILSDLGYMPQFFEPHDMFPGTHHYEVLTVLTRQ